ncbi:hypothetical protein D6T65_04990 [Arthrobacter frigidicola]|nr:hypothetical protein D6T65_04990 [Arthrobacter frigidicola]
MAETKNYDNIRVYGDLDSEVFLAPLGSTLPTDLTEPAAPFKALGWLSEDGVSLAVSTDVEKFKGWQGGTTLRTKVTSTEKSISIQALEETPGVTELYHGHGAAVVSGTGSTAVARVDLPEGIGTIARAAVFKFVDGGVTKFLCCEKVEVTDREELSHTNSSMTMYGFTLEIIGDSYILTNAPAYLPAA